MGKHCARLSDCQRAQHPINRAADSGALHRINGAVRVGDSVVLPFRRCVGLHSRQVPHCAITQSDNALLVCASPMVARADGRVLAVWYVCLLSCV